MVLFGILIAVVDIQLYAFVKTHRMVHHREGILLFIKIETKYKCFF